MGGPNTALTGVGVRIGRLNRKEKCWATAVLPEASSRHIGIGSPEMTVRHRQILAIVIGTLTLVSPLVAQPAAGEEDRPEREVRRSDVAFFIDDPVMYEPYGCTVVGWGGVAKATRIQGAHESGVRLYATAIAFRTAFHRVIDFSDDYLDAACRNYAGEPFAVPWLWDQIYKDQPVWWGCTNSPLYREFLEDWLARSMATGPDGLHIDDYSGTAGAVTWLSAGFCKHCMAGFRDDLAKHVSKDQLAELGITDLATFDYRQFLMDRGISADDYKRRRGSLPLADEFLDYQVRANTEYVQAFHKLAGELRGKPVTLSVNTGLNSPVSLAIAPYVSYCCCEVGQDAASLAVPKHPIYIFKLADGLDRPLTVMASGQDHAYIMEHNLPGLARTWIANAYAFGHAFVAPHRLWCYTQEKGTHWYNGPTEEYAWLFQFVRKNARLLDHYEAVAPVAVVYDNAAQRKNRASIEPICIELAEKNVPFTVVVAGDQWLDYRLDADQLARFKAVVVAKDLAMDDEQRKMVKQAEVEGRLVVWPDDAGLDQRLLRPVIVEGSEYVGAVPRAIPGDDQAPVVVHLLNRQYNPQQDGMVMQQNFVVRLRRDLFGGRSFGSATLHAPHQEPQTLKTTSDSEYTTIEVGELGLWGILELTTR